MREPTFQERELQIALQGVIALVRKTYEARGTPSVSIGMIQWHIDIGCLPLEGGGAPHNGMALLLPYLDGFTIGQLENWVKQNVIADIELALERNGYKTPATIELEWSHTNRLVNLYIRLES
jgi:hypothetical protein